ncbi:HTH_Tnp_Tc3_2 domain-containing protein [Trichonephila clavipes]|nr:HTH_Tnp_Tc3_2 domain-containing protein [Trichonephila clavipes]
MTGKRARRHFSQNCWWQWTREGTHVRKTGSEATRKTTRREDRRIVRQELVDPTVTRSTIRADVGVAIVLQTISRHLAEANLKSKRPFRALPLTPEHRQLRLQWCSARSMWNVTDWKSLCLVMNPGFFWGQMITVYGYGGALFGLAIHQNDHQARRRFVKWAQNEIAVVLDFHKRILFSDEAHFWLNGYVNKQNCRIWSEANPQVYVETPLHPEKLTVWCAIWAGGILLQKR